MKIFELFGSILIENDGANESLDKTDSKAKKIVDSLGNGIKTAAKWGTAIVGASAVVGGAMLKAGDKFAATTDNIDKMSQKLGLTREGFQEWDFILSQNGASIDGMKSGMVKLNNSFDELKDGSGTGAAAFERLGLTMDDLAGKSQEEIFEATITALQGVSDESERAAIANDLLGKSAVELTPLLNAGAGSVEDMKNQAKELGLVLGDDAIDAGVKYTDTMDQIKRSLAGVGAQLMSGIMPVLQEFMDLILNNMPMIQEVASQVFGTLGTVVAAVLPMFVDLAQNVLPPLIDVLTNLVTNVVPVLVDLFTVLVTNVLPPLIELFSSVLTAILPPLVEVLTVIINEVLPPIIDLFLQIVDTVLPPLIDLFTVLIETMLPPLIDLFMMIIENVLPIIMELFTTFTEVVLPPLIELIDVIVKDILPPLLAVFMELAEIVLPVLMDVFRALIPVIEPIMYAIADVINIVLALIKGDWEGVWDGIKSFFGNILDGIIELVEVFADLFSPIFQGIADVVGGIWDGLVEGIKSGINVIISGINTFIRGLNKLEIPDWVPGVGGKGINLSTIPMLAEGGDITKSGKILVGENGPEIFEAKAGARVTPLDKATGSGDTNVKNEFNIAQLVVREESDIKKIAKELYNMQRRSGRAKEVLV